MMRIESKHLNPLFPLCIALALVVLASCGPGEKKSDPDQAGNEGQGQEETTQGEEKGSSIPFFKLPGSSAPRKPWPSKPVFHIYYEKAPIPEAFLKKWVDAEKYDIRQQDLVRKTEPGKPEWPADGDLYVVSPRLLPELMAALGPDSGLESIALPDRINPLFTGYDFDPENRHAIPWRWSPYVFYSHQEEGATAGGEWVAHWKGEKESFWPDDIDLLWGLQAHQSGQPPVLVAGREADPQRQELQKELEGVLAPEKDCWDKLKKGDVRHSLALAAWRLNEKVPVPVAWHIPPHGTLIYLEHLAVSTKSPYKEQALSLVTLLLSPESQEEMLATCGYFPVQSQSGHELDGARVALPGGSWMDYSEFLTAHVDLPEANWDEVKPEAEATAVGAEGKKDSNENKEGSGDEIPVAVPVLPGDQP